jgi:hypothetical protein
MWAGAGGTRNISELKNAILMAHGIAPPSRVRIVGETSRTEWNQCYAPCPAKLNRTAVAQGRPRTKIKTKD